MKIDNILIIINQIIIIVVIFIGLICPRVSSADQLQNLNENLSNPLQTPNFIDINKGLSEINQSEIISSIAKPLDDVIRVIRNLLNNGGSVVPQLKSSLEGISDKTSLLTGQYTFGTMSIGEITTKAKEAFVLITQILIGILEILLRILKIIPGIIS